MALSGSAWRALSVFLLFLVTLQFYLIISHPKEPTYRPSAQPPQIIPAPAHPAPGEWRFKEERDANNPALTTEQCDAAFPDLYYEIDRSVKWWTDHAHNITEDDVEISWRQDQALRFIIYNNQLRVVEAKNTWGPRDYRRTISVMSQLHRALLGATAAGEVLPNIEFAVTVDDMSLIPREDNDTHAVWAFTRNVYDRTHDREWLMPDFNYWAVPPTSTSFYDMQLRAQEHDAAFIDKIPQIVWRGVKWTNPHVRGNLLEKTAGKAWADVAEIDWDDKESVMRMEELCRYAFVVHTEGRSWSGRLKYILNCDSVPVVHKLDWMTHVYHLLVPDGPHQNYVPVKRDFADLEKKVKRLLARPEQAQRIADNAVKTFRSRYTTMAAESCYWRRLIRAYGGVSFRPDAFERVIVRGGDEDVEVRHLRGKTYEEIIMAGEQDITDWTAAQNG